MKKCLKTKFGFTLAEVLITLAIIGIVAALTIPTVVRNYQKTQYTAALKKTYSALSQAAQRIMIDNGGTMEGLCSTNACIKNLFLEYMNNVKSCEITADNGCWHKIGEWFTMAKVPINSTESGHSVLVGADGALIIFLYRSKDCDIATEGITLPVVCARVRADINGFRKPNTVGRDIFDFYILKDRVVPRGGVNDATSCPSWGCAGKVLREGAMNY